MLSQVSNAVLSPDTPTVERIRIQDWETSLLITDDSIVAGRFRVVGNRWVRLDQGNVTTDLSSTDYFLSRRPIDVHCHGVGPYDFTDIRNLNLEHIEEILAAEAIECILTMYLPQESFEAFIALMEDFAYGKQRGKFQHITGLALEGPVLSSRGGTPQQGVWMPTVRQWQRLAACGSLGLRYCVVSPDAFWNGEQAAFSLDRIPPDVQWITDVLLDGGVLPAPGHFRKDNPERSAACIRSMLDRVARAGLVTISDHLFNDMPLAFKHAWRSPAERANKTNELAALNLSAWSLENLEQMVGVVPAALMRAAREGVLKVCLNFDGEHVDHQVAKRAVEIIGAENIIAMTDRIDSHRLAGRDLQMRTASTLLYEHEGIVAAGTQSIDRQREYMLALGLRDEQIWRMFAFNAAAVFNVPETLAAGLPYEGTLVADGRRRGAR